MTSILLGLNVLIKRVRNEILGIIHITQISLERCSLIASRLHVPILRLSYIIHECFVDSLTVLHLHVQRIFSFVVDRNTPFLWFTQSHTLAINTFSTNRLRWNSIEYGKKNSRNCMQMCVQNVGHFVQGSVCQIDGMHSNYSASEILIIIVHVNLQ